MWTVNFQIFKLVLEKAEEPESKLPKSVGLSKKPESSRKTSISALLTMPKPLTVFSSVQFSSVAQSCPTLCDPMDCSPQGSSVHGILQARIPEWVAISFCRGSSQTRDQTQVSCIGRWILYHWATREALSFYIENRLKTQFPTIERREPYLISYDKP